MHFTPRVAARAALLIAALVLMAPASFAAAARPDPSIAIAVPEPSQMIDTYEGSLQSSNAVTGSIHNTSDDFDWWCFRVTSGIPVTVTVTATGGTGGIPNCGIVSGVAEEGDPFESLGQILMASNNGASSNASFTYIPSFSGPATVWISSVGSTFNMNYSVTMSGGQFNPDCGPTDVGVTKTVSNPSPNVGQGVTYAITVTNNGPANASNIQVTDVLPAGVPYASHVAGQGSYVPGTGVWSIGNLVPGASVVLSIGVTVSAPGGQTVTNTASITHVDQTDPVPGNNSASANLTVQSSDLRVTKSASTTTPNVGQNITYTVTVTNLGPNNATGVVVTDLLDSRLTYVSSTPSIGSYVPGTGVWTIGPIANGVSVTLTLVAKPNTGTAGSTIPNVASITAVDQADPAPSNNSATVNVTVQSADLRVTKTVDNSAPNVGQNVTYTITICNLGPSAATNVLVSDLLPASITYVSASATQGSYVAGTGLWIIGPLPAGACATLTIVATIGTGTAGQTIPNTASVTGADQADPVPGNNSATVNVTVQSADLRVTKTVDIATPNVGQNITYTVTVTNFGPNNATNVRVTDVLDSRLTYVSSTPNPGTYVPGTGLWTIGSLANAASATLTLVATVKTGTVGQTIPNTASITGVDQADPVPGNNTATVNVTVQSADLRVTKTVDISSPNVGQNVTFTVNVCNLGPNSATNVRVTDQLPAGLTYLASSPGQGNYVPGTGVWTIGTLTNSACVILTITATVNSGMAGQAITNTAALSGADQADPVPGNNSASVTIQVGCPAVDVSGTVTYYSNGRSILPSIPDVSSAAVTVKDCNNTANNDLADNTGYSLAFGNGPFAQICICSTRPKADCDGFEGGVISGADLILLEDFVAFIGTPTPKQSIAGDLNKDGMLLGNDELAVKQWIGRGAVCSGNTCTGGPGQNCAGTWRFIYPTGAGPSDFVTDQRCLPNVCVDQTVPIQGILLGDVDGSWPNIFPSANVAGNSSKLSDIGLAVQSDHPSSDIVRVVLSTTLTPGKELHHVIYSLEYDAEAFQYLGAQLGDGAKGWGLFDNPDEVGVAHGIAHRLGGKPPITSSGDVIVFQFRMRTPSAAGTFNFSRLKANDRDVDPERRPDATPKPTQYSLSSAPNPFNPTTHIRFAIPENAGVLPVTLSIYDITGRRVRTLFQGQRGPGFHDIIWNGTDDRGSGVGTGIYVVRIHAGAWTGTRKITMLK